MRIKHKIQSMKIRKPVELLVYAIALVTVLVINFLQIPKDELQAGYELLDPGTQPVIMSQTAFVYSEPEGSAAPIDTLSARDEVTVLYSENGWSHIQAGPRIGWIENSNISHLYTALIDQDIVLTHSGSLQGSEAVAIDDSQVAVIVLKESEGWAQVKYQDQMFWVQEHHLEIVSHTKAQNLVEAVNFQNIPRHIDLNEIADRYQVKTNYLASHPETSYDVHAAILSSTVMNGMTKEQVAVSLGEPGTKSYLETASGITEQWEYRDGNWQTFVNFSGDTVRNWWQAGANLAQR
ncbi:MAG: SH3 domain-containing protein [Candidatus Marinimicrobia bacterium]|nr:SH3 domain-containing protein [Candidatus Neomarinimicrobiota bacterium]